jgi:hypothetical protein
MQLGFPLAKPYPGSKKGLPLSSGRLRFLSGKSGAVFKEATLRRILTVARKNPDVPCPDQKAGSGKRSKVSEEADGVHAEQAAKSY